MKRFLRQITINFLNYYMNFKLISLLNLKFFINLIEKFYFLEEVFEKFPNLFIHLEIKNEERDCVERINELIVKYNR